MSSTILPDYTNMDFDLSDISDLSSVPSSPPPSERYLTPSSQEGDDSASRGQDPRPAKKRRRKNPLPRERTTQYLNLSQPNAYEDQYDQMNLLLKTLRHQKDIVAIAGAGISTSAGSKFFVSRAPSSALTTPF
jgi:NAD-dependent histone deacetylase SIR2